MAEQQGQQSAELMTQPGVGGGVAQAVHLMNRARAIWAGMPQSKRTKLILAGAVMVAACALVSWWGTRTEWKTLYSGLEVRDLQQVESELAAAGITYETTQDGSGVEVPVALLDKARMEVAAKGTPQSGRMGFELFDKPNWVGSEFDEKVNYQRALEGELEHTIATISAVRSARVHLVMPKDSLFSDGQKPAKASVVLKLKRSTLQKEEIESIRSFVASAVDGLQPDQVTLIDADGRVNLNSVAANAQSSDEEQALSDKLVAMLEPLAGRENVRATVNIAYDQSSQERTDEVVDPTQVVAVQTQKSVQQAGAGAGHPQGVPGTASNTPITADKDGKAQLPVYPASAAQQQNASEESSTFAVTKHTTHEAVGPGRVARVTAAVLINDRALTEGAGKGSHRVWRPRTIDEMKRLEELARAAVGFEEKRGDSVVLQNIAFTGNAPEPVVTGWEKTSGELKEVLRSQPELLKNVGGALLAVLMILLVVRPVAKSTMTMLSEAKALPGAVGTRVDASSRVELQDELPELEASRSAAHALPGVEIRKSQAAIDAEGVLEYVTAHVKRDPQQTTRLLEAWIGGKERS
ncbi:MAG: flagellar basal-body MS-ring/collar protein FliF [Acidobacteriaceae bacterium]|nr:flagellar basal-body MS-ring/collar protein FliF [Acidobacteriaceae bacterium]